MKMRYTKEAFCQAVGTLYGMLAGRKDDRSKWLLENPIRFRDDDFVRNMRICLEQTGPCLSSGAGAGEMASDILGRIFTARDVWDETWDDMLVDAPDMGAWFDKAMEFLEDDIRKAA